MAKTMTTSEFAEYIFNKFPQGMVSTEWARIFNVVKAGCHSIVFVRDMGKSGSTKVLINGKSYAKMNATEKREAVKFIDNLEFDIVTDHDVISNYTQILNYETGTFFEGQEINVVGSDRVWRRIEKVEHIK